MTIRIHPAENPKEYTEALLTLLARSCIPMLTESLPPEGDAPSAKTCTASISAITAAES